MPTEQTALARRAAALRAPAPEAPQPLVQRTVAGMLAASVDSFGDVVTALLTDLEQVGAGVEHLGWLAPTMDLLANEQAYRTAVEQLGWWDAFLAELPRPTLLSDHQRPAWERARAEQTRARILARQEALAAHRRAVTGELCAPGISEAERAALHRIYEEPAEGTWRVDLLAIEARHLAALPPLAPLVPIVPADLDASTNFSGFNAVNAMRSHPELGPRAARLDAALAAELVRGFGLPRGEARARAEALTGIFWLALRRALQLGGNSLAASVHLFLPARDNAMQRQFTRELFESWVACLESMPEPAGRRALGERVPLLGALLGRPALPDPLARPQLEDRSAAPWWRRFRGR